MSVTYSDSTVWHKVVCEMLLSKMTKIKNKKKGKKKKKSKLSYRHAKLGEVKVKK